MPITKTQLIEDRNAAMKAKIAATTDEEKATADVRLSLVRQLLGAVAEAETAGKSRHDLGSDELQALLKRERSKRLETVRILTDAGETDRAAVEEAEADLIDAYLPTAASEAELREFLTAFIAEQGDAMPSGGAAIGVAMKALKARFDDFDARVASGLIRELA